MRRIGPRHQRCPATRRGYMTLPSLFVGRRRLALFLGVAAMVPLPAQPDAEADWLIAIPPGSVSSVALIATGTLLVPLRRMQADSISFVGAKSGQYTGVLHVIDLFSQFTWAVPVVTLGKQSNTIQAFKAILNQIKERYGDDALPERMTLQTDNGPEFRPL